MFTCAYCELLIILVLLEPFWYLLTGHVNLRHHFCTHCYLDSFVESLQKCTTTIRQLAHGSEADHLAESLKIAETTTMEAMKYFVEGVIAVLGERYLRRPTMEDVERLLKFGERRGFPDMFGSIDCMHWSWENVQLCGRTCLLGAIRKCRR
jgi:hypothetical protein